MTTNNEIIKEIVSTLTDMGHNAEATTVVKNKVEMNGIIIRSSDSNVAPCIYVDEIIKKYCAGSISFMDMIGTIVYLYKKSKKEPISMDFLNPDFIYSHVYIGVQQKSEGTELITAPTIFPGIEQYMYIDLREKITDGSVKVTKNIIDGLELDLAKLWECALQNTQAISIKSSFMEVMPLLTNETGYRGASAMLFKDSYKTFSNKVVIIPSSIHEVIVMDCDVLPKDLDISSFVKEVNRSVVEPKEWLSDCAYILDVENWKAEAIA